MSQNLSGSTYPTQNYSGYINNTFVHRIGNSDSFDGYLTDVNFIDGQALTPASFGETDAVTGVWKPKKYAGTYGTNGFYLNFSDPSAATAAAIGKDYSGNGNNWTPNNISVTAGATYDSTLDVPTLWADGGNGRGNYATFNPALVTSGTLTDGNLTHGVNAATDVYSRASTIGVSAGQWYAEASITSDTAQQYSLFGILGEAQLTSTTYPGGLSSGYCCDITPSFSNFVAVNNNVATQYGALTRGYVTAQVAFDATAGKIWLGFNGTWMGGGNPAAGTLPTYSGLAAGVYFFVMYLGNVNGANTGYANFGQRPFSYTPPTGFKALNTQNLPEPTIKKGNQYFDATTYTGNGGTLAVVNAGGFQPDLVWGKSRSLANDNALYDAVRGATKVLISNGTGAEATLATALTSFDSSGFTLGSHGGLNTNASSNVAWQWKESVTAGFDIVTYTGTGVNRTVAHNLGVAPNLIIVKNRGATAAWAVRHSSLGANDYLLLNLTNAVGTSSTVFNGAPSSTVFNVGIDVTTNANTNTYVAYLFAEVAGFSKFGSYTGNGSADGPFVFCGFRPRFVMVKRTDAVDNWIILDTARNTNNVSGQCLYPNLSNAENGPVNAKDFLSNGFKCRSVEANISGSTYIFAAFAENPFKNSLAR